ncbi:hypothetical protein [Nostocoides sp. HKS02]|uniref:hypothetical protein n=1 Tax=Nostocoides sp. HKS02 TaxID=1813880 RepID=UPI0012B4B87B|nr:hypothetical protein [Tetrasphaera sp. HKS02]QGN57955.1 hypothetical protein GKE56_08730 [Tetrasphaera sp. HKS02]
MRSKTPGPLLATTAHATDSNRAPGAPTLGEWASGILLFGMLFVPTTYQSLKLPVLSIALLGAITSRGGVRFNRTGAVVVLGLAAYGTMQALHGAWNANPGAYSQSTVYTLWPIVFLVLASQVQFIQHLRRLFRVCIIGAAAIGAYGSLYILSQTGVIPASGLATAINQGQGIVYSRGILQFSLTTLSSLLFLVPFLITLILTWPRGTPYPINRWVIYFSLISTIALVILSGRRALLLVFALSPILAVMLEPRLRRRIRRLIAPIIVVAVVGYVIVLALHLDLQANLSWTVLKSDSQGPDANARSMQLAALLQGWSNEPIFGSGLGGVAPGAIRNLDTPWAYELAYVALLFHVGLSGVILYGGAIGGSFAKALRESRKVVGLREWSVPLLVGLTCFLIGNITNPYLEKFDSLWVLFIPLMLLQVWKRLPPSGVPSAVELEHPNHNALPLNSGHREDRP